MKDYKDLSWEVRKEICFVCTHDNNCIDRDKCEHVKRIVGLIERAEKEARAESLPAFPIMSETKIKQATSNKQQAISNLSSFFSLLLVAHCLLFLMRKRQPCLFLHLLEIISLTKLYR
jgi:hypothetical protein